MLKFIYLFFIKKKNFFIDLFKVIIKKGVFIIEFIEFEDKKDWWFK